MKEHRTPILIHRETPEERYIRYVKESSALQKKLKEDYAKITKLNADFLAFHKKIKAEQLHLTKKQLPPK